MQTSKKRRAHTAQNTQVQTQAQRTALAAPCAMQRTREHADMDCGNIASNASRPPGGVPRVQQECKLTRVFGPSQAQELWVKLQSTVPTNRIRSLGACSTKHRTCQPTHRIPLRTSGKASHARDPPALATTPGTALYGTTHSTVVTPVPRTT